MNVLFDENVPRPLRNHFGDHSISTVQEMGWSGVKNGRLLDLCEAHNFDVLFTFDRNLEFQQNMAGRSIAILVVIANDKRLSVVLPRLPEILAALATIRPGTICRVPLSNTDTE